MATYVQKKRSIVKAITFRTIVLISDFTVVYLITHRVDTSLVGSPVMGIVGGERVWTGIKWGRIAEEIK